MPRSSSSSLLLSSLELSDSKVYEPYIRARLGTATHFCEVVVRKLRTVPIGTALSLVPHSGNIDADYSQVDVLGVRYKSVNFGAKKTPSESELVRPNRCDRTSGTGAPRS